MGPSTVSNNLVTCSLPRRGSCDISSPVGLALASGLAATVTITHMLKSGDGIVCMDDVYGGERKAVQRNRMSHVQKGFFVRKRKDFVSSLCVCVFCSFYSQGTNRYFQRVASNLGLEVSFADCTKPEQLKTALKSNTKVSQRERIYEEMQSVLCMFTIFMSTFGRWLCHMYAQNSGVFSIPGEETRKLLIKLFQV